MKHSWTLFSSSSSCCQSRHRPSCCYRCSLCCLIIVATCRTSLAFPIQEYATSPDPQDVITDSGWERYWIQYTIGLLSITATAFTLVGCLCCRRHRRPKGFQEKAGNRDQEFKDGSSVVASQEGSIEGLELPRMLQDRVQFEPIPVDRIISTRQSPKPKPLILSTSFHEEKDSGVLKECRDWFESRDKQVPRERLKYLRELGHGWFGKVVEGRAELAGRNGGVVVRILTEEASSKEKAWFLREATPYLKLNHTNVLALLGFCIETDPYLLLFESCQLGDLKGFLVSSRDQQALRTENFALRMALDVVSGLRHMHQNGFVHTDLAARNCLVCSDLTVKLGDYGTGVERYPEDYYVLADRALPIRWSAPESIECTETTIETREITGPANAWTLAILLFEVLSLGRRPFDELTDEQVIEMILSLKRETRRNRILTLLLESLQDHSRRANGSAFKEDRSILGGTTFKDGISFKDARNIIEEDCVFNDGTSFKEEKSVLEEGGMFKQKGLFPGGVFKEDRSEKNRGEIVPGDNELPVNESKAAFKEDSAFEELFKDSWKDGCPLNVLQVMRLCLDPVEGRRPSLEEIRRILADEEFEQRWESLRANSSRTRSASLQDLRGSIDSDYWTTIVEDSSFRLGPQEEPLKNPPGPRIVQELAGSGSETEEESWKGRIERGVYTEKVKQKSKSVTDLMVLVHIDLDSEAELSLGPGEKQRKKTTSGSDSDLRHNYQLEQFDEALRKLRDSVPGYSLHWTPPRKLDDDTLDSLRPDSNLEQFHVELEQTGLETAEDGKSQLCNLNSYIGDLKLEESKQATETIRSESSLDSDTKLDDYEKDYSTARLENFGGGLNTRKKLEGCNSSSLDSGIKLDDLNSSSEKMRTESCYSSSVDSGIKLEDFNSNPDGVKSDSCDSSPVRKKLDYVSKTGTDPDLTDLTTLTANGPVQSSEPKVTKAFHLEENSDYSRVGLKSKGDSIFETKNSHFESQDGLSNFKVRPGSFGFDIEKAKAEDFKSDSIEELEELRSRGTKEDRKPARSTRSERKLVHTKRKIEHPEKKLDSSERSLPQTETRLDKSESPIGTSRPKLLTLTMGQGQTPILRLSIDEKESNGQVDSGTDPMCSEKHVLRLLSKGEPNLPLLRYVPDSVGVKGDEQAVDKRDQVVLQFRDETEVDKLRSKEIKTAGEEDKLGVEKVKVEDRIKTEAKEETREIKEEVKEEMSIKEVEKDSSIEGKDIDQKAKEKVWKDTEDEGVGKCLDGTKKEEDNKEEKVRMIKEEESEFEGKLPDFGTKEFEGESNKDVVKEETKETLKEGIGNAKEEIERAIEEVKEKIRRAKEDMWERMGETTKEMVQKKEARENGEETAERKGGAIEAKDTEKKLDEEARKERAEIGKELKTEERKDFEGKPGLEMEDEAKVITNLETTKVEEDEARNDTGEEVRLRTTRDTGEETKVEIGKHTKLETLNKEITVETEGESKAETGKEANEIQQEYVKKIEERGKETKGELSEPVKSEVEKEKEEGTRETSENWKATYEVGSEGETRNEARRESWKTESGEEKEEPGDNLKRDESTKKLQDKDEQDRLEGEKKRVLVDPGSVDVVLWDHALDSALQSKVPGFETEFNSSGCKSVFEMDDGFSPEPRFSSSDSQSCPNLNLNSGYNSGSNSNSGMTSNSGSSTEWLGDEKTVEKASLSAVRSSFDFESTFESPPPKNSEGNSSLERFRREFSKDFRFRFPEDSLKRRKRNVEDPDGGSPGTAGRQQELKDCGNEEEEERKRLSTPEDEQSSDSGFRDKESCEEEECPPNLNNHQSFGPSKDNQICMEEEQLRILLELDTILDAEYYATGLEHEEQGGDTAGFEKEIFDNETAEESLRKEQNLYSLEDSEEMEKFYDTPLDFQKLRKNAEDSKNFQLNENDTNLSESLDNFGILENLDNCGTNENLDNSRVSESLRESHDVNNLYDISPNFEVLSDDLRISEKSDDNPLNCESPSKFESLDYSTNSMKDFEEFEENSRAEDSQNSNFQSPYDSRLEELNENLKNIDDRERSRHGPDTFERDDEIRILGDESRVLERNDEEEAEEAQEDDEDGEDSSTMSLRSDNSYVSFGIDEEFVAQIRNELIEKLPCAQMNVVEPLEEVQDDENRSSDMESKQWDDEDSEENSNQGSGGVGISIRYNVYGTPLSPILEERESTVTSESLISNSRDASFGSKDSSEDILLLDTRTNKMILLSERIHEDDRDTTNGEISEEENLENIENLDYLRSLNVEEKSRLLLNTGGAGGGGGSGGGGAPLPSPEEESKWQQISSSSAFPLPLPLQEDLMSTSFARGWASQDEDDEDDEDENEDENSSSSGEFVWKRYDEPGRMEQQVEVLSTREHSLQEQVDEELGQEEEEEEEDEEHEEEFTPSAWDASLAPHRSALRSPDKSLKPNILDCRQEQKKTVWFKKQRYHCVYEYPKESNDAQPSTTTWEPTSYADWEEMMDEPRLDLYPLDYDDAGRTGNEEFFVSSTSRPFQSGASKYVSQFFPGSSSSMQEDRDEVDGPVHPCQQVEPGPSNDLANQQQLGELRHTRDRLKLNLSTSSPNQLQEEVPAEPEESMPKVPAQGQSTEETRLNPENQSDQQQQSTEEKETKPQKQQQEKELEQEQQKQKQDKEVAQEQQKQKQEKEVEQEQHKQKQEKEVVQEQQKQKQEKEVEQEQQKQKQEKEVEQEEQKRKHENKQEEQNEEKEQQRMSIVKRHEEEKKEDGEADGEPQINPRV